MRIIIKLKNIFIYHFFNSNTLVTIFLSICYFMLNWLLLFWCKEQALLGINNYIYWTVVTVSTVGYGDLSPTTTMGKYVVALFTIPFGISIFALIISRIAIFSSMHWKNGIRGLRSLHMKNHIVIIGWNNKRTLRLLNLLIAETQQNQQRKILLCATENIDNPMPEHIDFVKVTKFNHATEMQRACVDKADIIVIDTKLDDITLTTALFCSSVNKNARIIVYFTDETLSGLLKKHCHRAECVPSLSVEILAKAAMDPGSSILHHELLSAGYGVTQYSVQYPNNAQKIDMNTLFTKFKHHYNATIIATMEKNTHNIIINPDLNTRINPGAIIYYIAKKRINPIDW